VFLEVRPEVALERIRRRNRPEEKGIDLDYLKRLDHKHQVFLSHFNPSAICPVNGNQDQDSVREEFLTKLRMEPFIRRYL
jgi:thymidylate kinase